MLETFTAQPLLRLDPDLGQFLSPDRLYAAEHELRAGVVSLGPGPWRPNGLPTAGTVGLLVVSGVLQRELWVHDAPSAELFGAGDIIRFGRTGEPLSLLPTAVCWTALSGVTVALMDRDSARALRRYPQVMAVVLDRFHARAERLAVMQAIAQITGVETRVEALMWHLAERWGRVGRDGLIIPLALSHRMIGALVGARRPTVSTALARLAGRERLTRRADGGWVLTGCEPPTVLAANPGFACGEKGIAGAGPDAAERLERMLAA